MKDPFIKEDIFQIYALSEQAVTLEFEPIIHENIIQKIDAYSQLIRQEPFPGFISVIPGYHTLTVIYNPKIVDQNQDGKGIRPYEKIVNYLNSLNEKRIRYSVDKKNPLLIPVCYGGDWGPDLQDLQESKRISVTELIQIHASVIYRVYMIGFMPGFAYLGGMDERLTSPRKLIPRTKVSRGSIGIAGKQTGIYPFDSPGGWQIIGRTPYKIFDLAKNPPSYLKSGDLVKFHSIDEEEFKILELENP